MDDHSWKPGSNLLAPEQVKHAYSLVCGQSQIRRLAERSLNGTSWDRLMRVNLDMILGQLTMVAKRQANPETALSRGELIEVRCAIDYEIRRASDRPRQYVAPLYISDRLARRVIDEASSGSPRQRLVSNAVREHVTPLTAYTSGTNILQSPAVYMPLLAHAFTTPICVIAKDEDPKGRARTVAPDVNRPFMRYADNDIQVYRVSDFSPIDRERFTWEDHISLMKSYPSYATGVEFFDLYQKEWSAMLAATGFKGAVGRVQ
jgi:hypothetical protein